jgi:hypothetical protein
MDERLVDQDESDSSVLRREGELIDVIPDRVGVGSVSTITGPPNTGRSISKPEKSFRELVADAERKFEDFVEREQQRAFAQRKDIFRVLAAIYAVHVRRLEHPSAYETFLRERAVTRDQRCKTDGALTIKAFISKKHRSAANMRERISQYGRALEVLAHRGLAPSDVVEWFEAEEIIGDRVRRGFEKAKHAYKALPGEQERIAISRKRARDIDRGDLTIARKRPIGKAVLDKTAEPISPGMVLLVAEADAKGGVTILRAVSTTERKAACIIRQKQLDQPRFRR